MMTLLDSKRGEKVRVVKINADHQLKQRLISFGVMKGVIVEVLTYAPGKKTIEIKVAKMRLALRDEEAKYIEVETL